MNPSIALCWENKMPVFLFFFLLVINQENKLPPQTFFVAVKICDWDVSVSVEYSN